MANLTTKAGWAAGGGGKGRPNRSETNPDEAAATDPKDKGPRRGKKEKDER